MSQLIDRLTYLRKQSGMTSNELTQFFQISKTSFTDWNKGKGKPSIDTLIKFAEYFNVSMDGIVFGIEPMSRDDLDFSNTITVEEFQLLKKYRSLNKDLQGRAIAYIDGMIAASQVPAEKLEKLSV